jgi:parallel beta-helix repeat protein
MSRALLVLSYVTVVAGLLLQPPAAGSDDALPGDHARHDLSTSAVGGDGRVAGVAPDTASDSTTTTCTVESAADSGAGTLRWCLSNAYHGDAIEFSSLIFPPTNPVTIALASELPRITWRNVTIDARNAGVIISGAGLPPGSDGLTIDASGDTIRGLTVIEFSGVGLRLGNNTDCNSIVENNFWNNGRGIYLDGSNNNTVSANDCSNNTDGIYLSASGNNTVRANTCWNNNTGIQLSSSDNNSIYLNSFTDNIAANVVSSGSSNAWGTPTEFSYIYGGNCYVGYLGNYWSDYLGSDDGSGGRAAGDGIGDTDLPFVTDGSGDNYPLMEAHVNYHCVHGDANADCVVDGRDVIRCKKIILGLEEPYCGADANEDSIIDGRDVIRIKKMILGIE